MSNSINVYGIHPETKEYFPEFNDVAFPCPIEKGVIHLPANSTELRPPKVGANQVPVFSNGKWKVMPDFRGQKFWLKDGTELSVTEIGISPPEGAKVGPDLPPEPTHEEKLADAKKRAKDRIKTGYLMEVSQGKVTALNGLTFDCRRNGPIDDIAHLTSVLRLCKQRRLKLNDLVLGKGIKDHYNKFHPLTVGQLSKILLPEMDNYMYRLICKKWELCDEIDSTDDISKLDEINWSLS